MMFPITRLFESADAARAAVDRLVAGEVPRDCITVIHAADPDGPARVDAAAARSATRPGQRGALKSALAKGRSIVAVTPQYGTSSFVEITLDGSGAIDTATLPIFPADNPSPFSDLLGLPVLTRGKSDTELLNFEADTSFGFPLLSRNPAPFSSLFGLKLLSRRKGAAGTSVQRMSGNPAPLSGLFGLKLLTSRKSAAGSSVERMSGNPAPLSRLLGLPVLTKRQ